MQKNIEDNGFSLLEVMGALCLISVAVLMICSSLITSGKSLNRSRQRFDFHEQLESRAYETIHTVRDPHFQGAGQDLAEKIRYKWKIENENGLIHLFLKGENQEKKLSSELKISKSAWLNRMEVTHG